jgi:hypothetical protein
VEAHDLNIRGVCGLLLAGRVRCRLLGDVLVDGGEWTVRRRILPEFLNVR